MHGCPGFSTIPTAEAHRGLSFSGTEVEVEAVHPVDLIGELSGFRDHVGNVVRIVGAKHDGVIVNVGAVEEIELVIEVEGAGPVLLSTSWDLDDQAF